MRGRIIFGFANAYTILRFTMTIPVLQRHLFFVLVAVFLPFSALAAGGGADQADTKPALYVKVQLKGPLKTKGLKTGDNVEGTLFQAVYFGAREVMPAGCPVRLTVDHLEKRRRAKNDHWPWVVQAFTPRHENYPVFRSASVTLPDGKELPLEVSFLSIANERQVQARARKAAPGSAAAVSANAGAAPVEAQPSPSNATTSQTASASAPSPPTIATFEAAILSAGFSEGLPDTSPLALSDQTPVEREGVTLEAGTQANVILLETISASKSHAGDPIQARLIEPVRVGSLVVLPEGTVFQGRIVRATHPKWLSRPGSLLMTFDNLVLLQGAGAPVVASVSGADLDRRSHTKIDSEGSMRGSWPGKWWMLINLGVTAGIAKEADDTLQLIIEAIVSTATDASTAGVARIFATCVSVTFMITRHGRDVVLPKFTEIHITLNRPLTLPESSPPLQSRPTSQPRTILLF
ncbi:MAG TPA: hypothetical protein VJW93_03740 [Candidatus Acidoferrales bacterium]|nr:hypothetical protein [Candidatus Acidoferrales bacterium]